MTLVVATVFGLHAHDVVAHEARRVSTRMFTGNDEERQLEDGKQTPELTATAVEEEDEQPVGAGTKQND